MLLVSLVVSFSSPPLLKQGGDAAKVPFLAPGSESLPEDIKSN